MTDTIEVITTGPVTLTVSGRRSLGAQPAVTLLAAESITALEFDDTTDLWTASTATGDITASYLVLSADQLPASATRNGTPVAHPSSWSESAYLGVVATAVPNAFIVTPGDAVQARFVRFVMRTAWGRSATRVTTRAAVMSAPVGAVRSGPSREQLLRVANLDHLDFSNDYLRDDDTHSGMATLIGGSVETTSAVRLSGHLDPIDGRFHWYGLIADPDVGEQLKKSGGKISIALDGNEPREARVSERTPWRSHRIEGTGTPPWLTAV